MWLASDKLPVRSLGGGGDLWLGRRDVLPSAKNGGYSWLRKTGLHKNIELARNL